VKQLFGSLQNTKGYAVAQLVEALHYKSEGHCFNSRWCHWNFSLASTSWNPQGLSRPVMGLLYLYSILSFIMSSRGGAVVEALRYKLEGRGIDS
jgi:hypothetical protein